MGRSSATVEPFEIRDFPGYGEAGKLIVRITADMAPYWDGFNDGTIVLQHCTSCGKARNPVAPVCPYCATSEYEWRPVAPTGSVFSWIRYHKVYQSEFEQLMPFYVISAQLDAGPRIMGRLASGDKPEIGMQVRAIGERWADGRVLPAFVAAAD